MPGMAAAASIDAPIAVYPVRTTPGYWFAAAMLGVLAALGGTAMVFVMTTSGWAGNGVFLVVAAIAAGAPVAYWLASKPYRIAGGTGEIRFYADRLEVPPASRGPMIVLPRAALHATSTEMRVRYRIGGLTAATVRRGHLLVFEAGPVTRKLSTLTVVTPRWFMEDLKLFLDDVPPIGPAKWAEVTAAERAAAAAKRG
jgi:hypothetical protein